LAKADLRDELKQITIPVLIIAGTHDPVTTVTDAEWMLQHIPKAQLVEINASHISNVEAPVVFNQYINQFI
jgi:3-oxoadipate enol-lactonase